MKTIKIHYKIINENDEWNGRRRITVEIHKKRSFSSFTFKIKIWIFFLFFTIYSQIIRLIKMMIEMNTVKNKRRSITIEIHENISFLSFYFLKK